jgi:hypothetical protein
MPRPASSRERLKKSQVSVYVDPEQAAALRELSRRTRVPQQVYLREGLDLVLQRYKAELRKEPKR